MACSIRRSDEPRRGAPRRPAAAGVHLLPPGSGAGDAGRAGAADAGRAVDRGGRPRRCWCPRRRWPNGSPGPSRRSRGPASRTACRTPPELPDRLRGVAATVYLIFNEGYARRTAGRDCRRGRPAGPAAGRADARRADRAGAAGAAAAAGRSARRPASTPTGDPVLLADQDRARWDAAADQGRRRAGRRGPAAHPGPARPVRRAGGDRGVPRPRPDLRRDRLGRRHLLVRRAARRCRTPRSSG